MHPWAKKTERLARTQDYLDRLYEVYPNDAGTRDVDEGAIRSIEQSFNNRDSGALLQKLLDLDKFPLKDSYVSFLRSDRTVIQRKPKTVKRISDMLFEMGFDKLRAGIAQPKEANTRRGPQFRNWAKSIFTHVRLDDFAKSKRGIAFLEDNEKEMLKFCNNILGAGLSKRPDFIAKSGTKYVVGEAKFFSSLGGNQGRGFDDAIKLASNTSGSVYKAAVIDGVVWIQDGSQEYKRIEHSNVCALSALLLGDFLKTL